MVVVEDGDDLLMFGGCRPAPPNLRLSAPPPNLLGVADDVVTVASVTEDA